MASVILSLHLQQPKMKQFKLKLVNGAKIEVMFLQDTPKKLNK